MTVRIATEKDIPVIHSLAHETWWPTYGPILTEDQISFMLDKMYSPEALAIQLKEDNVYLIAERESQPVAFASFSCTSKEELIFKLHKIYILPSEQGKGTGKKLVNEVIEKVKNAGGRTLELNVNRHNPAFYFYKKMGFEVFQEADIPFYQFYMNDYIMRKSL